MYEEIFPSSLSLRSRIFIMLQNKRGRYCDKIKLKDYFQIKFFPINYFICLILFDFKERIETNNRRLQEEMKITRKKIDDPTFYKNYLESYPFF
jgi:hypothetical protein